MMMDWMQSPFLALYPSIPVLLCSHEVRMKHPPEVFHISYYLHMPVHDKLLYRAS